MLKKCFISYLISNWAHFRRPRCSCDCWWSLIFGCGNTTEEACKDHDNNLHGLLETTRKIGLWFNSVKIWLQHKEVCYLGYLISGNGLIKPDPEKVAAIMKMQKSTDIKSMQKFIGFVNYFATICEPLHKLSCNKLSSTDARRASSLCLKGTNNNRKKLCSDWEIMLGIWFCMHKI